MKKNGAGTRGEFGAELEALGLSSNEATVLLAVLRLSTANSLDVANESGVARTNVYRVLEDLGRRRLVERLPGDGPATWASPGLDEVIDRLHLDQEERLLAERDEQAERAAALHAEQQRRLQALQKDHDERIAELGARVSGLREMLGPLGAGHAGAPLPKVQVISSAAQVARVYDQLLDRAHSELLVLVRPPYTTSMGTPKQPILDALARGVESRAIYETGQLGGAGAADFRREMEAYHQAGVSARVTESLPLKMAIIDRAVALVALMDDGRPNGHYPAFLLVEQEGFATYQANAFDHYWAGATPYEAFAAAKSLVSS